MQYCQVIGCGYLRHPLLSTDGTDLRRDVLSAAVTSSVTVNRNCATYVIRRLVLGYDDFS